MRNTNISLLLLASYVIMFFLLAFYEYRTVHELAHYVYHLDYQEMLRTYGNANHSPYVISLAFLLASIAFANIFKHRIRLITLLLFASIIPFSCYFAIRDLDELIISSAAKRIRAVGTSNIIRFVMDNNNNISPHARKMPVPPFDNKLFFVSKESCGNDSTVRIELYYIILYVNTGNQLTIRNSEIEAGIWRVVDNNICVRLSKLGAKRPIGRP